MISRYFFKTGGMLQIALQKSGRLSEGSFKLLSDCGIAVDNSKTRLLATASNFEARVLYLRDDDIPQYVEEGVADVGIVGENVVVESQKEVQIVRKLGFSKCRVSLAVPKNVEYTGLPFFQGKKIATSFPNILKDYLQIQNIQAEIHKISGSVEIAPGIGLADAIMDIVSSGSTLFSNGLSEVAIVLKSQAVLIANNHLSGDKAGQFENLKFRIDSVLKARDYRYILLNAPNDVVPEIIEILPGMKSPTILPLAESGWSSIHSVIQEGNFWEIIDKLKKLGAQGVLIIPIEKMVV